jgi:hypothetical protein
LVRNVEKLSGPLNDATWSKPAAAITSTMLVELAILTDELA